jgi:hypothetical protein
MDDPVGGGSWLDREGSFNSLGRKLPVRGVMASFNCDLRDLHRQLRIEPQHAILPDREIRRTQRLRFERFVSLKVHYAKHRTIGIDYSIYLRG